MRRKDRIEFASFDGQVQVRTGQGDHCVFVEVKGIYDHAAAVLTDTEAEALGWSLIRRARYSRERSER